MIELALLLGLGMSAGFLGSLLGLGGGVILVPGLTLGLGFPLRTAVAASLVGVVATSAGSTGVYLEGGRVDLPLALKLETFAVGGAVLAGLSADLVPEGLLYFAFALVVLYAGAAMFQGGRQGPETADTPDDVRHGGWGMAASGGAGVASALLGVGGGFAKVPIMHAVMGVPMPVATATSALMVGITASASSVIYWLRGDLLLEAAAPVALGVLIGSGTGSRVSSRFSNLALRILLALVLVYIAGEMGWNGYERVFR